MIILPDSKTVIKLVVNVLHHDLLQKLEIHHHSLFMVTFLLIQFTFDGGDWKVVPSGTCVKMKGSLTPFVGVNPNKKA